MSGYVSATPSLSPTRHTSADRAAVRVGSLIVRWAAFRGRLCGHLDGCMLPGSSASSVASAYRCSASGSRPFQRRSGGRRSWEIRRAEVSSRAWAGRPGGRTARGAAEVGGVRLGVRAVSPRCVPGRPEDADADAAVRGRGLQFGGCRARADDGAPRVCGGSRLRSYQPEGRH